MGTSPDESKKNLISKAAELAASRKGTGGPPPELARQFLEYYYRHVADEDLSGRSEVDVYGAAVSQYKLAAERPQGKANIRAFTPSVSEHGWSADGHTVVEVVTDDMPFLVDSITMELVNQQRDIHLVIHPQLDVERDITGDLLALRPDDGVGEAPPETIRESWMHIEIDRVPDTEDTAAIEADLQRVLRDVREAVEDWDRMHAQVLRIIADLETDPPPLPAGEIEQGRNLLQWLADGHFTFLGYREYRLEGSGEDEALRAVPGTGYGILRADQDLSQ